jgi:hypothetical protein
MYFIECRIKSKAKVHAPATYDVTTIKPKQLLRPVRSEFEGVTLRITGPLYAYADSNVNAD